MLLVTRALDERTDQTEPVTQSLQFIPPSTDNRRITNYYWNPADISSPPLDESLRHSSSHPNFLCQKTFPHSKRKKNKNKKSHSNKLSRTCSEQRNEQLLNLFPASVDQQLNLPRSPSVAPAPVKPSIGRLETKRNETNNMDSELLAHQARAAVDTLTAQLRSLE